MLVEQVIRQIVVAHEMPAAPMSEVQLAGRLSDLVNGTSMGKPWVSLRRFRRFWTQARGRNAENLVLSTCYSQIERCDTRACGEHDNLRQKRL